MVPSMVIKISMVYTASEVLAPIGGVCFSLPSPSCRGAARGALRSGGGQAKACPTSDEALTQQLSALCINERLGMSAFVDNIVSGRDLTFNLEFQRDEESGWLAVHVVELPGCVSQGATIEEAKTNIANALEMYMAV